MPEIPVSIETQLLPLAARMEREKGLGLEYHEAQVAALIEEIAVYIDAVRLAQILGDQSSYSREVLLLKTVLILDVPQLCRQRGYSGQPNKAARDGRHVLTEVTASKPSH